MMEFIVPLILLGSASQQNSGPKHEQPRDRSQVLEEDDCMCSTAMHVKGTDMYLILGSEDPNPVGVGGKSESNKCGCDKGWEAG